MHKVILSVTADSDVFAVLDITGSRDGAMIREKIFSKVCESRLLYFEGTS